MEQGPMLYTLPQWFVFSAVIAIVYGWVEQKKVFMKIGLGILILLSLFSVYLIAAGHFAAGSFLTPEEIVSEQMEDEILPEIPIQVKLLPAYISFIFSGLTALPALYFVQKEKKTGKWLVVISVLISLLGFFMVVGVVKNL